MTHKVASNRRSSRSSESESRRSESSRDDSRASSNGIAGVLRASGPAVSLGVKGGSVASAPSVQGKVTVGDPDDRFEKEAERVADQVMRMPDPGDRELEGGLKSGPGDTSSLCPRCQRRRAEGKPLNCTDCEQKLQRKHTSVEGPEVVDLEAAVKGSETQGSPLPASTLSFFEKRMGADFSGVRVHRGMTEDAAARAVSARAFTLGRDIVFRSGEYRPHSPGGKRLLAHELTHIVQQTGSGLSSASSPRSRSGGTEPASLVPSSPLSGSLPSRTGRPIVQRQDDRETPEPRPGPEVCPTVCQRPDSSPGPYTVKINFAQDSSRLTDDDRAEVYHYLRNWHASGGAGPVRLDGFASPEGDDCYNLRLSCDRAATVVGELVAPRDGSVDPIPPGRIEYYAHGESNFFGEQYAPNRTAIIAGSGIAPEREPGEETEPSPPECPIVPTGTFCQGPEVPTDDACPDLESGSNCRGACGPDCPDSCEEIRYAECVQNDSGETYSCTYPALRCGTHEACREHDDCYDACAEGGEQELCPYSVQFRYANASERRREFLRNLYRADPPENDCHCFCDFDCIDQHGAGTCLQWAMGGGPNDGNRIFITGDPQRSPGPVNRCSTGVAP